MSQKVWKLVVTSVVLTMALVRRVADAVSISCGAGGVADGRGPWGCCSYAWASCSGWYAFSLLKNLIQNFKDKILKAKNIDTVISAGCWTPSSLRINWLLNITRLKRFVAE